MCPEITGAGFKDDAIYDAYIVGKGAKPELAVAALIH
jgi:hypothetical protein